MNFLFLIFVFFMGLLAGSFLNCVIYRLEQEESFWGGRSYCPSCKKEIFWFDLIPLLSFLFLWGKCRFCEKKISWQYPVVEFLTGIIFLMVFLLLFPQMNSLQDIVGAVYVLSISLLLILILVYDLKHFIIPDEAVFAGLFLSLLWYLFAFFSHIHTFEEVAGFLLSSLAASAFFLALFLVTRGKGMGFGDVKFALLMGIFLGYPKIIVALFLSFLIGAIIGTILMAFKKKGLKSEIPFAPFLVAGTFIALFWGDFILTIYPAAFVIY